MPQPFAHALAWLGSVLPLALLCSDVARAAEGAQLLNFYGYHDCIQLSNDSTEVILCPAAGGRVLSYALEGANILYLPRGDEGWVWDGSSARAPMHAGRFDIGPEQMVPRRPTLWQGKWTGEIVGDRAAVLRSQYDASTGVQLERRFELAADSSKLECTQTIINASPQDEERTVEYCHWSRTFVNGYGTCVLPVSRPSRFPQFYVRYDPPNNLINFQPNDRHIQLVDDHLIINARPLNPKLGFDSQQGWLAYLSRQHLLFIKTFPTYPERVYNEVAGLTISVWYPAGDMVELEPIGPRERLAPGESASFTETWHLLPYSYPGPAHVNPKEIAKLVEPLR